MHYREVIYCIGQPEFAYIAFISSFGIAIKEQQGWNSPRTRYI